MVPASPAANAVRGRSHDICYIDDEATGGGGGNAGRGSNGLRHTEVILDVDERVQVKVSGNANKKSDLMQLQWGKSYINKQFDFGQNTILIQCI